MHHTISCLAFLGFAQHTDRRHGVGTIKRAFRHSNHIRHVYMTLSCSASRWRLSAGTALLCINHCRCTRCLRQCVYLHGAEMTAQSITLLLPVRRLQKSSLTPHCGGEQPSSPCPSRCPFPQPVAPSLRKWSSSMTRNNLDTEARLAVMKTGHLAATTPAFVAALCSGVRAVGHVREEAGLCSKAPTCGVNLRTCEIRFLIAIVRQQLAIIAIVSSEQNSFREQQRLPYGASHLLMLCITDNTQSWSTMALNGQPNSK